MGLKLWGWRWAGIGTGDPFMPKIAKRWGETCKWDKARILSFPGTCIAVNFVILHCSEHHTVYTKKYAHGFVVLCFVVVMQSFIMNLLEVFIHIHQGCFAGMNSLEVFIHIHQGCFAGTGAIVKLPQCQWSKPDGYGKISQCITTTKHSKAKTVIIFLGIYCISHQLHQFNIFATLVVNHIHNSLVTVKNNVSIS